MTKCPHEMWEKDTAVADGMCPLCLAADNQILRDALQALHRNSSFPAAGTGKCYECGSVSNVYVTHAKACGWRVAAERAHRLVYGWKGTK